MNNVKMGKKCIPGIICLENMTLFLLFFLCLLIMYMYFQYVRSLSNQSNQKNQSPYIIPSPSLSDQTKLNASAIPFQYAQAQQSQSQQSQGIVQQVAAIIPIFGLATPSQMNDPYSPPLRNDGVYFPTDSANSIPINVKTRGYDLNYSQIGILTRTNGTEMILPLMGRKNARNRDKWQYYTISNSGNLNTKLPVSSNGRSCTSENGCDEIYNGDVIYVEGYNDTFKATIYENSLFRYLPF